MLFLLDVRDTVSIHHLLIVINIQSISDRRDPKHQIPVPSLAILSYHKSFVLSYQAFFFQHIHILDHSIFGLADGSANRFITRIASVGSPVLALHQKSIDSDFLCRQPEVKNSVRQRKEITHRERTVVLTIWCLTVFIHFLSSCFVTQIFHAKRKSVQSRIGTFCSAFALQIEVIGQTSQPCSVAFHIVDFCDFRSRVAKQLSNLFYR